MNAKYFEENRYEDYSIDVFHNSIGELSRAIMSNLMVEVADPDARKRDREANAYHMLIALCEAGLSRLDPDTVKESREKVTLALKPMLADVLSAIFKR